MIIVFGIISMVIIAIHAISTGINMQLLVRNSGVRKLLLNCAAVCLPLVVYQNTSAPPAASQQYSLSRKVHEAHAAPTSC